MKTDGLFYTFLKTQYNDEVKKCIEQTVQSLSENETNEDKPGMLLGKIQSGKTETFLGIIGLSFDNDYDVVVVLTKGTKALTNQTLKRIQKRFDFFLSSDKLQLFDIMSMPDNLTKWELNQKCIIVCKKETNNLMRLFLLLFEQYNQAISKKNILIIDDEADFASVGYRMTRSDRIEMQKIAEKINDIRRRLSSYDFLQVTATPYSLYLQPESPEVESQRICEPVRPAFTELVPINQGYIGGEYYFEESGDKLSTAFYLFQEVSADELQILREPDRRRFKIEEIIDSDKVISLRTAVVTFIVGGCIRRLQSGSNEYKTSFIVHTEKGRGSHQWQEELVMYLIDKLIEISKNQREKLEKLIKLAYDNLEASISTLGLVVPELQVVTDAVVNALQNDYVMVTKVNSDKDINVLLDNDGQLKLRTPLNIFIGGQILDRGITIRNLIGFFYGRTPNRFQQDTVLQHSRMYGFRPLEDLAVTRFYTTQGIYDAMEKINEFDTALRNAFIQGAQNNGVVFIRIDDSHRIVPCSPNKILISTTTTLTPNKRILPIGFSTNTHKHNIPHLEAIECIITKYGKHDDVFKISLEDAKSIIVEITNTLVFESDYEWEVKAFIASLEYLSMNCIDETNRGFIGCLVRRDRELSQKRKGGRFSGQPDDPDVDLKVAKAYAITMPVLMLIHQKGLKEHGWNDSQFWWPVLITPKETRIVVFANDLNEPE